MQTLSGLLRASAVLLFAVAPTLCLAVDTQVWEQSDQADFARGTPKNLSIRSDGHLTVAPRFKELDSTSIPYLWALAQDSQQTLYYAGGAPTGATTRIYALPRNGKPKVFADLTGLEIHALAVDSENRVYAAVLPDAKIYRIDKSGKPELFFDPKCKYIWAMAFDHAGNLFVATGDSGIIYKVTPDGKGSKFFDTEETHARSMIIDGAGNLIVGTEPSGLILRVSPAGKGFVLYQAAKREITAVAEHAGVIYAAAVGNKTQSASITGAPPVLPSNPAPINPTGAPRSGTNPPSLPPAVGSLSASVTGGSELYRIQASGFAERVWSSPTDLVYCIAFDSSGRPLLGTGNKGIIYRVDSEQLSTQLLNAPPTQVTAFLQTGSGTVYAATGNVGNLYAIGPGLESNGTLSSEVLDANSFAYWGKVHLTSNLNGGTVELETRSGNLNNPENSWSPWSKVDVTRLGGSITSPAARFLQYRLKLAGSDKGVSPEVSTIDIAYLPKNAAPVIHLVDVAPFNYRQPPSTSPLERSVSAGGSPTSITLAPVGQRKSNPVITSLESSGNATLQYAKGYLTLRWNASDPNNDALLFKVEIRPKNSTVWRTLKDKLQDRFFAFDTAAFPDGQYIARITASDSGSNTPETALSSTLESDPFTIDNTPPEIVNAQVAAASSGHRITFTARDALSWIGKAEYAVDGGDWTLLEPVDKVTDSQTLNYRFETKAAHLVAVRIFDEDDNVVVKQFPLDEGSPSTGASF